MAYQVIEGKPGGGQGEGEETGGDQVTAEETGGAWKRVRVAVGGGPVP